MLRCWCGKTAKPLLVQKALAERNVPSVLHSTENLFDSAKALEMQRFLAAAAEPNAESMIKAALSTDMVGITGEELERLMLDEARWESRLVKFRDYHELWQDQGFFRMFRFFLKAEKVLARLMVFADGERRNTNLLHLMEVLHQASMERKLNMTGLLKWLRTERPRSTPLGGASAPPGARRERGEARHHPQKAKGLSIPLCLPFFVGRASGP